MKLPLLLIFLLLIISCVPKEEIVLRDIKNIELKTGLTGEPLLTGDAVFHNPNRLNMLLKEIDIEVFVDDKKAARSEQKMDAKIPAKDDFTVPLEVKLNLQELGLLDTLLGLFTGKKHDVRFHGFVRVRVHGVLVKIPIDYKSEIKLKI